MINVYKKGKVIKLSANFKSTEFDCKGKGCCGETRVDHNLVSYLQKIRDHFGKPVTINSGYRCNTHNKAVGGATSSRHIKGEAADIKVKGVEPKEVAKYAESIGIKGIGLYDWGCHIDTRTSKFFWIGDKQTPCDTFGGAVQPANPTVLEWQKAAIADGFRFASGANGIWSAECETVAKKAICKKRLTYKYRNLTAFLQNKLGIEADGKFGKNTKAAVEKFQRLVGLIADGEAGINTWKKIINV